MLQAAENVPSFVILNEVNESLFNLNAGKERFLGA